jgi:hypothetical protein
MIIEVKPCPEPASLNVSDGSRLCENSNVELARRKFVSITLNKKRAALPAAVERRKERKQFCAFSALARFHTAWVNSAILTAGRPLLVCLYEQTLSGRPGMSERCQEETRQQQ